MHMYMYACNNTNITCLEEISFEVYHGTNIHEYSGSTTLAYNKYNIFTSSCILPDSKARQNMEIIKTLIIAPNCKYNPHRSI